MPGSAIHNLPYPTQIAAGPGPDVPADVKALVDAVDPKLSPVNKGLFSARPPFGKTGQRYYATDESVTYLDIGTAWIRETPAGTEAAAAAGTRALRSLGVGATDAAAGNDARLSDERVPTNGSVTAAKVAAALKPSGGAAAATESLRALGVSAGSAAAGNDSRLSDQRVPTDNSVTNAKMADNAVNTAEIVDNAVTNPKMADNAVNTAEIVNEAVTPAKLAPVDAWTALVFSNAWTNFTGAGWRQEGKGQVLMKGDIQAPGAGAGLNAGGVVFTLPVGARPPYRCFFQIRRDSSAATVWIAISTTGAVTLMDNSPAGFVYNLAPVTFPIA